MSMKSNGWKVKKRTRVNGQTTNSFAQHENLALGKRLTSSCDSAWKRKTLRVFRITCHNG
ncbi:hypothetical protein FVEN_g12995 [Fusarium venenatum]|uniref:Uncharacterized protein n=1 Tax=Fusarium venenatum TaxID=56646 RepID=A0A2L2TT24_9HYPO|nr:uncharacterized protein FVRRES_03598 [Fusarium venenatum]KAG8352082.1 hypothetical protein FVEN_g12995 [Fusarium venenatum]CEI67086.1 unnamed protein product [Fusarium venenatum]